MTYDFTTIGSLVGGLGALIGLGIGVYRLGSLFTKTNRDAIKELKTLAGSTHEKINSLDAEIKQHSSVLVTVQRDSQKNGEDINELKSRNMLADERYIRMSTDISELISNMKELVNAFRKVEAKQEAFIDMARQNLGGPHD